MGVRWKEDRMDELDVVVVGAGLSGLWLAKLLVEQKMNVVVLEARDRVGGRTKAECVPGDVLEKLQFPIPDFELLVDVGGQWIGPQQTRINDLVKELGLKTKEQFSQGKTILELQGKKTIIEDEGAVYPEEFSICINELDRLAQSISTKEPWESQNAKQLDQISVSEWVRQHFASQPTITPNHTGLRGILASDPEDISLLYWLTYIAKAKNGREQNPTNGNVFHLSETLNGAQQDKLPSSAWNISQQVYQNYLPNHVRFNSPVTKIEYQQSDKVVVWTSKGECFKANRVVVAIPPPLCESIEFIPKLPGGRMFLQQRMFMGSVIKVLLFYSTPFWKDKHFSGLGISDETKNAFQLVYDASYTYEHQQRTFVIPGLAVFFLGSTARQMSDLSQTQRVQIADDYVHKLFDLPKNDTRGELLGSVEGDWCSEVWSRGGYVGVLGCGTLSQYGQYLTKPSYNGRLLWCGTETAHEWTGYLEGALESAERVVHDYFSSPTSKL